MHLEQFVNEIERIYGDNLGSLILFGSATANDHSAKYSDFNLIIVLKRLNTMELARSSKIVKKWMKNNSAPLFFDPDHIRTSSDVFPIEFFDIKDSRKVLFGSDPFEEILIDSGNLRHQCEYELKGKILQLQSKYVEVADNNRDISRLMMESLPAFISIFKGILRLLKEIPNKTKRALVEQLSAKIDFNPNIFMELLDIRDGNAILPRKDSGEKFEDYLEELKKISKFVDQYKL